MFIKVYAIADYCLNIIAKLPYCREVPIYHEPLIAIVVTGVLSDRSTGLDNPHFPWHPIVTIPLQPDFGGVTDGTNRAKWKSGWLKPLNKYEKTRAYSNNAGGLNQQIPGRNCCRAQRCNGCSYKTFMNGKPHSSRGPKGVVGLKCWFEKMEQVFEICKCAEDDKVKFVMYTFEGRALTWWNGNVQTLGLANANQIPWSNVKAMMTTEYCPATEIQRMEQEL
ncbi:hypothetical protein Tco_1185357 [Tanacetum coccineum]